MDVKRLLGIVTAILLFAGSAAEAQEPLTLKMPEALRAQGFDQHLLPRFRFRSRITVEAVTGGSADMVLSADGPGGTVVFSDDQGKDFRLRIRRDPEGRASAFLDWLRSTPGRAAISGFEPVALTPADPKPRATAKVELSGDAAHGRKLAHERCQRCHVVNPDRPFAGIGSTPSFPAIRSMPGWRDRFTGFWGVNPHRGLVAVEEVHDPNTDQRPVPMVQVRLTLDDVDDILAYVATLTPLDLGAPVASGGGPGPQE